MSSGSLEAEEKGATPPPTAEALAQPKADAAAAQAEFQARFAQWKELLSKMRQLSQRYRVAPAGERQAIRAEYEKLTSQGHALAAQLRSAAEAAYVAGPDDQAPIADFLLEVAGDEAESGRSEEGLRIAKLLIEHGGDRRAYVLAGAAAFSAGKYPDAIEYLGLAEQAGALDDVGRKYLREARFRAEEAEADDLPRVLLKTEKGDIVLELFENQAPNTVANFVSLVDRGYYNGLTFHRVLPGFMAQGGCPLGTGRGGPGYRIRDEVKHPDARNHFRGSLSMAKTQLPDSGGSQFFLTFKPTSHLDGLHTVFGRVLEGMDVVDKITLRDPDDPNAPPAEKILEAKVLRKRDHEYKPETLPE